MVNSDRAAGGEFWGHLLKSDKTPTDLCRNLLQGLANYISNSVEPKEVKCLAPVKLAAFYHLLGGNYDPVFVDTPHPTLSSIYRSLGCRHSLGQPKYDDFAPPSIPVLTRDGFVRWQTIQLLLDPGDHVPFLQRAVGQFDIINPAGGEVFPKFLPKEAFPSEPDEAMTEWHDNACQRLRMQMEQPASAEGHAGSTHEFPDLSHDTDKKDYFSSRRPSNGSNGTSARTAAHLSPGWFSQPGEAGMRANMSGTMRGTHRGLYDRRRSYQDELHRAKPSHIEGPWPSRRSPPRPHRRRASSSGSNSQTSSFSSSDSDSVIEIPGRTSSGPSLRHHRSQDAFPLDPRFNLPQRPREIRRSSDQPLYASRGYGPRPSTQLPQVYRIPNPASFRGHSSGVGPPRGEPRETTIRWDDIDRLARGSSSAASAPGGLPGGPLSAGMRLPEKYGEIFVGRGSERPRAMRVASPARGVDGRRYPGEGVFWR